MYRGRDLKKFWNLIHGAKNFKQSTIKSDVILNAELEVQTKLDNLHNVECIDKVIFKSMVIRYNMWRATSRHVTRPISQVMKIEFISSNWTNATKIVEISQLLTKILLK